jgi:hypothetical protein
LKGARNSTAAASDRRAPVVCSDHEFSDMSSPWLGLIEMGVVLLFGVGWGVLELVGLRLDRKRKEEAKRDKDQYA